MDTHHLTGVYGSNAVRAAGKSTHAELVCEAINKVADQQVITPFDCSTAINWCEENMPHDSALVRRIRSEREDSAAGGLNTPLVVVSSLLRYIHRVITTPKIMIAGFPRDRRQPVLWNSGLHRPKVQYIEIDCSKEQMFARVAKRQTEKAARSDEAPDRLERSWTLTEQHRGGLRQYFGDYMLKIRAADTDDECIDNIRRTIAWMSLVPILKADALAYTGSEEFKTFVRKKLHPNEPSSKETAIGKRVHEVPLEFQNLTQPTVPVQPLYARAN